MSVFVIQFMNCLGEFLIKMGSLLIGNEGLDLRISLQFNLRFKLLTWMLNKYLLNTQNPRKITI